VCQSESRCFASGRTLSELRDALAEAIGMYLWGLPGVPVDCELGVGECTIVVVPPRSARRGLLDLEWPLIDAVADALALLERDPSAGYELRGRLRAPGQAARSGAGCASFGRCASAATGSSTSSPTEVGPSG
jgi:hypothetical protein